MKLSNDDIINLMIVTGGYHNSRYIRVDCGIYIVNKRIKKSVIQLGQSKIYSELKLKGSDQHKGIKKMIHHCKLNEIYTTGHEIKSLFRTRKRSKNSKDIIFCSYQVFFILKALTELIGNSYSCEHYYDFLPDFYREINLYHRDMNDSSKKLKKTFKNGIRIQTTMEQLRTQIEE